MKRKNILDPREEPNLTHLKNWIFQNFISETSKEYEQTVFISDTKCSKLCWYILYVLQYRCPFQQHPGVQLVLYKSEIIERLRRTYILGLSFWGWIFFASLVVFSDQFYTLNNFHNFSQVPNFLLQLESQSFMTKFKIISWPREIISPLKKATDPRNP